MKGFLIFLGFFITWCLIIQCYDKLSAQVSLHDKISYEAMMCLQDKNCTLTYDKDI